MHHLIAKDKVAEQLIEVTQDSVHVFYFAAKQS